MWCFLLREGDVARGWVVEDLWLMVDVDDMP